MIPPLLVRASARHYRRHPWQFGLAGLGIALGVALAVGIDLAAASVRRAFALATEAVSGRATHAITQLRELEARGERGDRHECARYALFRGLAHLTLGDALAAERWLLSLKQKLEREPGLLSGSETSRLESALGALGQLPGD